MCIFPHYMGVQNKFEKEFSMISVLQQNFIISSIINTYSSLFRSAILNFFFQKQIHAIYFIAVLLTIFFNLWLINCMNFSNLEILIIIQLFKNLYLYPDNHICNIVLYYTLQVLLTCCKLVIPMQQLFGAKSVK